MSHKNIRFPSIVCHIWYTLLIHLFSIMNKLNEVKLVTQEEFISNEEFLDRLTVKIDELNTIFSGLFIIERLLYKILYMQIH